MSGDICRRTLFAPTVYRANNSVVKDKKKSRPKPTRFYRKNYLIASSNTWILDLSPSVILTCTFTVSPTLITGASDLRLELEICFKASTLNSSLIFSDIHSLYGSYRCKARGLPALMSCLSFKGVALTLVGRTDGNSNALILYHISKPFARIFI